MNLADYVKTELPKWPNWLTVPLLKLNVFGPLVYGRGYLQWRKQLDSIDPERQLLTVVNHALRHVPYYRSRYPGLEVHSLHEFETKIGFIDKDEVMAHWEEFVADDIEKSFYRTGTTGGTSGKPLKLLLPKDRYVRELPFTDRMMHRFGWNFDTVAAIRNHRLPAGRNYMVNPVMRQVIFDAFRMDETYARIVYRTMRRLGVRCFWAYPSALFQFAKLCHHQGLDLSFVKMARLTSEQITDEQRYLFCNVLHIPISYSYGHSEKLILAGNTPDDPSYHVEGRYGYMELIDADGNLITRNGEEGEMVGTTFSNFGFPLIRYRTGDYSSYVNDVSLTPYDKVLRSIQGRWQNSLIYCADGRTVSTTSLNLHGDLYERIDGLQYVQEQPGSLDVLIIKGPAYNTSTESALLHHFQACLGAGTVVNIHYVDKLQLQPNGKFLLLISHVKNS